jgi:hypothetical protein
MSTAIGDHALLSDCRSAALVAAPTTSLPQAVRQAR